MSKAIKELKSVAIFTKNVDECFDIIGKLVELGLPLDEYTSRKFKKKDDTIIPSYYKSRGLYINYGGEYGPLCFRRVDLPTSQHRKIKYIEFIGLYLKAKEEMEVEIKRGDWSQRVDPRW